MHDEDPALVSDLLKDLGGDPAVQSGGHFSGPRIAVVEDEPAVLELLRDVLNIRRYFVIGLKHPDVYAIAAGLHPDLFLIDLMLPDMSGIELARQLRAGGFERTPMIAISASSDFLRAASDSGLFQAVLAKPFEVSTMLEYVDRYATAQIEPAAPMAAPAEDAEGAEPPPGDKRAPQISTAELLTMLREQQDQVVQLTRQMAKLQAELEQLRRNGDSEMAHTRAEADGAQQQSWWQRIRGS